MSISDIDNLRKPETLEEKYKVAVNALQAISQYDGDSAFTLERVASKQNRSNVFVPKYYHKEDNVYRNEKNQRTFNGKVQSLSDKLSNLPWS